MTVNPFDLKTAVLAKHAQHVVLIHFPIALFLAAVAFDFIARWTKRRGWADAAYLQPARGSDFNCSCSRHWASRVAVPAGGTEAEGHPIAAPSAGLRFNGDDLAGVVGAFPRSAADGIPAELPSGGRTSGSRSRGLDGALGRLFEWCESPGLGCSDETLLRHRYKDSATEWGNSKESSMTVNKGVTSRPSPICAGEVELLEFLSQRRAWEDRDREVSCSDVRALVRGIRNGLLMVMPLWLALAWRLAR